MTQKDQSTVINNFVRSFKQTKSATAFFNEVMNFALQYALIDSCYYDNLIELVKNGADVTTQAPGGRKSTVLFSLLTSRGNQTPRIETLFSDFDGDYMTLCHHESGLPGSIHNGHNCVTYLKAIAIRWETTAVELFNKMTSLRGYLELEKRSDDPNPLTRFPDIAIALFRQLEQEERYKDFYDVCEIGQYCAGYQCS